MSPTGCGSHPCVSAETIRTGVRAQVSQVEPVQATRGGAVYTARMAGYQDELAGIGAVRGRAADTCGLAESAVGVRGRRGNAGHDEPG
jgi:hypothetical protein